MSPPDRLAERLDAIAAGAQAEQRMPSLAAAAFRDGEVLWRTALGSADVARSEPATPDHAYRIGSITKTFTAIAILQLRDAMVVDLDDPLRTHVPEIPAGPTVRDALSHLSGFQREPPGDIWETLVLPSREELLAGLEDAERVLRPGASWHYSNLAFGLLGEIVARRSDGDYESALRSRLLEPLGLDRTGFDPPGPRATGYFVDPWSDRVTVEAELSARGPTAAMGWLWSTVDDLARWADFLATGRDGILAAETLDEMARVQTMVDQAEWSLGWGLGVVLYRRGERVYVGHGGAMPGFLAAVCIHRPERTGAAVLCNTGAGARPRGARTRLRRGGPLGDRAEAAGVAARRRRSCGRRAATRPVVVGGERARAHVERRTLAARARRRPVRPQRVLAHARGRRPVADRRGP